MRVGCVICSDAFSTFVDVASVPCGHTFHTQCLMQWIEKSKSCPTCRHKATYKNILKLYFDPTGEENSQVDPEHLQNQIDSLRFQVVERQQTLKTVNEKNTELNEQTKGLRDEVLKLEKCAKQKETTISAYKDQVRHLSTAAKTASKAQEEAKIAKAELKLYKEIKTLLDDNSTEIDETVYSNSSGSNQLENIKNLATICCVLKSRLNALTDEKKRRSDDTYSLLTKMKEMKKCLAQNKDKIIALEKELKIKSDDLEFIERENKSLQKKISKLQDAIISPSADVKNSAIHRLISESPAPLELKRRIGEQTEFDLTPEITRKVPRTSQTIDGVSSRNEPQRKETESDSSPYLQVKSASLAGCNIPQKMATNALRSPKSRINILREVKNVPFAKSKSWSNVPVYPGDDTGYDGLGGHHKVDYFPTPNSPTKKPERSVKIVVNKKGRAGTSISSKSIRDFFKDPFSD